MAGSSGTNRRRELTEVSLKILHETEKAYLVTEGIVDEEGNEKKVWIPKSQCELNDTNSKGISTLTMPEWLAIEKGFISDD